MAATIARAQGYQKHGGPQNAESTRLGHGHAEASAATWQTFAYATIYADGHGSVEVRRNGEIIHQFSFGPEAS